MEAIKLTKEQVDFLKLMSTQINDGENNWYYMPFWLKQIGEDKFQVTQFEKLPGSILDILKENRNLTDECTKT